MVGRRRHRGDCSGERYPGEPKIAPVIVSPGACSSLPERRARPKSRIFRRPSCVRKRFSGFNQETTAVTANPAAAAQIQCPQRPGGQIEVVHDGIGEL